MALDPSEVKDGVHVGRTRPPGEAAQERVLKLDDVENEELERADVGEGKDRARTRTKNPGEKR